MNRSLRFTLTLVLATTLLAALGSLLLWLPPASAAAGAAAPLDPRVVFWGYLAAALATSLSSAGAAYAVAHVGAAAIGALTEKPELFGRLIILVGLAEGIAIYGLIISVLILNRLG
jgi:V/A-type H+/Na+-transporting ATPase subunit K